MSSEKKVVTFLTELAGKRDANFTNVFLLETQDPKRIDNVKEYVKANVKQFGGKKIFYNIQTQEILDIHGEATKKVELDPMKSVNEQLLTLLRTEPTVIIMSYVFEQRHANALSDFLAACAHRD